MLSLIESVVDRQCAALADGRAGAAEVAAVAQLLQHRAVLLCPPAAEQAAAAALRLLSALRAAELRATQGGAKGLEQAGRGEEACTEHRALVALVAGALQRSVAPPAPLLCEAGAAGVGSPGQDGELAALVGRLGYREAELQAAQYGLLRRTQVALARAPASEAAAGRAVAAQCHPPAPLEALLAAAVATPERLPPAARGCRPRRQQGDGSGDATDASASSALRAAAREVVLVMRQLPQARLGLSPCGWQCYWLLEPLALQQALAEVLLEASLAGPVAEGAAGAGAQRTPPLARLLEQRPHWAALPRAAAERPALHLAARRALHGWLAASGSMTAWDLLALLVGAVRSACQRRLEQGRLSPLGSAAGAGPLPAELRLLYPPSLWPLAAVLHAEAEAPFPPGLLRASAALRRAAQAAGAAPAQQPVGMPAGRPGVQWLARQQLWELILDCPKWLSLAMDVVGLDSLLAASSGSTGTADVGPSPGAERAQRGGADGEAAAAAAQLLAWAVWPHAPACRRALSAALAAVPAGGEEGQAAAPCVWPWLELLQCWREHWRSAA
eukprot:scaffold16.g119.t1